MRTTMLWLTILAPCGTAAPPSEKPLPPREAPHAMKAPEGFRVTLFAGEPDVAQPVACCFDDRGRLWVCECRSYPHWIKDGKPGHDRVLIFEDVDNDGVFDRRTVFLDGLANLTSIEFGFGGVYLLCAPNLLFVPLRPGTDHISGPARVMLDGWSLDTRHNIVNGLRWGPDGWLYGCHGILATSHVGKPGTPKEARTPINCGVWRFHPLSHRFEVVAHGTTNPWGIDWDERGELYLTNCVIDHAFHLLPGGHYQRMFGQDLVPNRYKLLGSCVDHLHWAGGHWTTSRFGVGKHSEAGGGHAHSGCMVYLGESFPAEYRDSLFTCNIHGNRVNRDRIDRSAKGPVLRHAPDFLHANDPWFRGLAVRQGPDGSVFVLDWCDTGECHNYEVAHVATGRIYKVAYGKTPNPGILLARADHQLGTGALLDLAVSRNEWLSRHARRMIQERCALDPRQTLLVREVLTRRPPATERTIPETLRWMWAAQVAEAWTPAELASYTDARLPDAIRAAAVTIACDIPDTRNKPGLLDRLHLLAMSDPSREVRLKLASGLSRLPGELRWNLATRLAARAEDADDAVVPLMIWYAIEPLVALDPSRAALWLSHAKLPIVREFVARRLASLPGTDGLDAVATELARTGDAAVQRDVLAGLHASLQGARDLPAPRGWPAASKKLRAGPADVQDQAAALDATFGQPGALARLKAQAGDASLPAERRRFALDAYVFHRPADLRATLEASLDDADLRAPAIRALAGFGDAAAAQRLLGIYAKASASEKSDVLQTLASRSAFAKALLDAVASKAIPARDLTSTHLAQLAALKDKALAARIEEVVGAYRPASREKKALVAKYKEMLRGSAEVPDLSVGKKLYVQHCASCHKLFGEGGTAGPELTGAQRGSVDYLLENILDPNAVVGREHQVTLVVTTAGRTIVGIVKEETPRALTLQTQNETVVVPIADVEERRQTRNSLMPEGILERLSDAEVRALFAFLQRTAP